MNENKLKDPVKPVEEEPAEVKAPRMKPASKVPRKIIRFLNSYGVFSRNQVVHSMPFILFVTLLIIGYIANSYYAERVIREIDKTKAELKEKRAEYISTFSQLMNQRNQSQVAKLLEPYQIKETIEPPGKIFITESPKK